MSYVLVWYCVALLLWFLSPAALTVAILSQLRCATATNDSSIITLGL
jgi:hypothetical protein